MLRISPEAIDLERVRAMTDEELGRILDRVLEATEDD